MKKTFVIKVTKQVTEWWTVEADDELDVGVIYDISGEKILTKTENEHKEIEESNNIKDGWGILGNKFH